MKLVQKSFGYDIYELTKSESIMRGRSKRQYVAFVAGENFISVGCPEYESSSIDEVLNYCEKWKINSKELEDDMIKANVLIEKLKIKD